MATRVYVTSRSIGTKLVGPPLGDWDAGDSYRDNRGDDRWTLLLDESATNGGVVSTETSGASVTKAIGQKLLAGNAVGTIRWATRQLDGDQTISGTLDVTIKVANTYAASLAEVYGHVYAYVTQGNTLTERTVLCDNLTDATNWTATATYRTLTFAISGSVAASAGDRIVVEFGGVCTPPTAPAGDNSYTIKYGTTNSSEVVLADAVNGDTADRAAWMEFSTTLAFQTTAAPANDACADAIVIDAIPYTSSVVDSTESTDSLRRVWWKWTATVTGRMFCTTLGGNYQANIRVNTGTCAGLSLVTQQSTTSWVGTSQTVVHFEATEGTDYFFSVQNMRTTTGTQAGLTAVDSGGATVFNLFAYEAPEDGDLFVSGQHIVCYRDGAPVNILNGLYNSTPTNSFIDYTEQAMDDLNGGTNSAKRLYVNLFGSTPTVEILDLATLNVGELEVDYIQAPLNYAGHSENASSIVFDHFAAGETSNVLIGYFGDNYNVLGGLSTITQCRVNRIDSTHADNQSGAPFADAEAFTVDQENEGSDYVELAADRNTLFYTSAGREVKRYDLGAANQLTDFATLPAQVLSATVPRTGARGVRLLWPFDGTGGALVAYGNVVQKIDGAGIVTGTYTPSLTDQAKDLDKVELAPDGLTAYVSDQLSCYLFEFSVTAMSEVGYFKTNLPPGQLCGFSVLGYRGVPTPPTFNTITTLPIRRLRRTPHTNKEQLRVFIHRVQVDLQPGIGATSGQGSDPTVMFRFSTDGGYTWSNERRMSAGALGRYLTRAQTYRLGSGRDWVFEVVVSDPVVPWVLLDFLYDPSAGTS